MDIPKAGRKDGPAIILIYILQVVCVWVVMQMKDMPIDFCLT